MHFKFKMDIYPHTVHVYYSNSFITSWKEYVKVSKTDLSIDIDNYSGYTHGSSIILDTSVTPLLPTLVHECIHAANHILHDVDIKVDNLNDEALAYLASFIFKKIATKLKLL